MRRERSHGHREPVTNAGFGARFPKLPPAFCASPPCGRGDCVTAGEARRGAADGTNLTIEQQRLKHAALGDYGTCHQDRPGSAWTRRWCGVPLLCSLLPPNRERSHRRQPRSCNSPRPRIELRTGRDIAVQEGLRSPQDRTNGLSMTCFACLEASGAFDRPCATRGKSGPNRATFRPAWTSHDHRKHASRAVR